MVCEKLQLFESIRVSNEKHQKGDFGGVEGYKSMLQQIQRNFQTRDWNDRRT